ncbi:hypothetical protein Taro_020687 [Colocasia esculenta]|uniref:Uncharacterized protein n=1 Tax=Colocasia esculenta TaxID=4460 RepID=A0A843UZE9_COLES|nr:hypothetical protein [Colocasia esculenta]
MLKGTTTSQLRMPTRHKQRVGRPSEHPRQVPETLHDSLRLTGQQAPSARSEPTWAGPKIDEPDSMIQKRSWDDPNAETAQKTDSEMPKMAQKGDNGPAWRNVPIAQGCPSQAHCVGREGLAQCAGGQRAGALCQPPSHPRAN